MVFRNWKGFLSEWEVAPHRSLKKGMVATPPPLHNLQPTCFLRNKGGSSAETCDQVKSGSKSSVASTGSETGDEVKGADCVVRDIDFEVFHQALERCLTQAWVSHHLARVVPRALLIVLLDLLPRGRSKRNAL